MKVEIIIERHGRTFNMGIFDENESFVKTMENLYKKRNVKKQIYIN